MTRAHRQHARQHDRQHDRVVTRDTGGHGRGIGGDTGLDGVQPLDRVAPSCHPGDRVTTLEQLGGDDPPDGADAPKTRMSMATSSRTVAPSGTSARSVGTLWETRGG